MLFHKKRIIRFKCGFVYIWMHSLEYVMSHVTQPQKKSIRLKCGFVYIWMHSHEYVMSLDMNTSCHSTEKKRIIRLKCGFVCIWMHSHITHEYAMSRVTQQIKEIIRLKCGFIYIRMHSHEYVMSPNKKKRIIRWKCGFVCIWMHSHTTPEYVMSHVTQQKNHQVDSKLKKYSIVAYDTLKRPLNSSRYFERALKFESELKKIIIPVTFV